MARSTLRTKNSVILYFVSRLRQDSELLLDIKVDVDDFFTNMEGPRIVLISKTPNLDCWESDGGREVEKYHRRLWRLGQGFAYNPCTRRVLKVTYSYTLHCLQPKS